MKNDIINGIVAAAIVGSMAFTVWAAVQLVDGMKRDTAKYGIESTE